MAKAKKVWRRGAKKADSRADTSEPPFVEMAKDELAEHVLGVGNTRMNAALGGFAPTLTTDDIKDDVKVAQKAAKGRSIDPDAPEAMAQTAAAHRAALGGLSAAEGIEGVALPKAKASAKD